MANKIFKSFHAFLPFEPIGTPFSRGAKHGRIFFIVMKPAFELEEFQEKFINLFYSKDLFKCSFEELAKIISDINC